MNAVILVPWRAGDPHREAAWQYVQSYYEPLGWPIHVADSGDEPFSRSASRNLAAEQAGDWDVAAILDADCIVDLDAVRRGAELAHRTTRLVLPHDGFTPLTKAQTAGLYAGTWRLPPSNRLFTPRHAPGGLVIVPRPVWDELAGYTWERPGWGGEDGDLLSRFMARYGGKIDRLHARVWHLWHHSECPPVRAQQVRDGEV